LSDIFVLTLTIILTVTNLVTYQTMANSRLAIAIHTLGVLAFIGEKSVSSKMIAGSVKTNPVVIRRILANFVKSGLVEVQMGAGGGSRLARSAEEISLADIYLALNEGDMFDVPILEDSHQCPIGRTVRPILKEVFFEAESSLVKSLGQFSLAEVIGQVKERMSARYCEGTED